MPKTREMKQMLKGLTKEHSLVDDGIKPRLIEENNYISESVTKNGEAIYFRMDLITDDNIWQWSRYQRNSEFLTRQTEGFSYLAQHTYVRHQKNGAEEYYFKGKNGETYVPKSGFNEEEFDQFINFLGQHGFTADSFIEYNGKASVLVMNSSGSQQAAPELGKYMVYATKTPDFRIENCPVDDNKRVSVKDFMKDYGDLLMSVKSNPSYKSDSSYQIGIFRNPCSVINEDYKNISMAMHSFTGAVLEQFFPSKKTMFIDSALQHMLRIMLKAFGEEDLALRGMSLEEARHAVQTGTLEFAGVTIKVSSLAAQYYDFHRANSSFVNDESSQQTHTI